MKFNRKNKQEEKLRLSNDVVKLAIKLNALLNNTLLDKKKQLLVFCSTSKEEEIGAFTLKILQGFVQFYKEKVLLLDPYLPAPDFSFPQTDRGKNMSLKKGLYDLLFNEASASEVIQPFDKNAYLHILAMGTKPLNYNDLLASPGFKTELEKLKKDYMVIINSPPILDNPNYALLAEAVDGVIFLLLSGQSKKAEVIETKSILNDLKIPVLGYILGEHD